MLSKNITNYIDECIQKENGKSYLISVLHKIQEALGYLPEEALDEVAYRMQIPTAYVSGVASFYHFFRLQKKGKYAISVCLGTACFVKGANEVLQEFKNHLGIDVGETSKDGIYSLEGSRCAGVCALAPVVIINNKVYSKVTPKGVPKILDELVEEDTTKIEEG